MKFPNGYGSITKLSGRRRKPYQVRITLGWKDDGTQIRATIGTASTKPEALQILSSYNKDPYDVDMRDITFKNLYDNWIKIKEQEYNNNKISIKSINRYKNAYKYYKNIEKKKFIDIKYNDLQFIIDNCPHGYSTKSDIKVLYSLLFEYASKLECPLTQNPSKFLELGEQIKSTKHKNFTDEEIKILWNNLDIEFVGAILIGIYTGARPSELLKIKEIHFENRYMIGGIKTKAGIDRIIPINEKIASLVQEYLIEGKLKISYQAYKKRFNKIMETLEMDHTPHDVRHTFATKMHELKADPLHVKLIMGHADEDITTGTYTHVSISELIKTVNLM